MQAGPLTDRFGLVLGFLSQFFQGRRHFSNQAKDRSIKRGTNFRSLVAKGPLPTQQFVIQYRMAHFF